MYLVYTMYVGENGALDYFSLYIECGLSIKKYMVLGFFLAFGENNSTAGSGATLPYSPTPCLKIRNMFDAEM